MIRIKRNGFTFGRVGSGYLGAHRLSSTAWQTEPSLFLSPPLTFPDSNKVLIYFEADRKSFQVDDPHIWLV